MTTALIVASTVLGAFSAVGQGVAENRAASYRAAVADMNAKIAKDNADRAVIKSQIDAQEQDAMTLGALGEMSAQQGASGLSFGSKSFSKGRKAIRQLGRLDALNTRQEGNLRAYNFLTDKANFEAEGNLNRMYGRNSLVQGFLGAGQSLISGATKVKRSRIGLRGSYGGDYE